jgi:spermidine synthase
MRRLTWRAFARRAFARLVALLVVLVAAACASSKIIYEDHSPQVDLYVTEAPDGMRTMMFRLNGAMQSMGRADDPDVLELPYARGMLTALVFSPQPKRVLIVGLGGGTLPRVLRKHYPDAMIDVAEIDPRVVDVAKRYFGLVEDDHLRVHVGDGRAFIEAIGKPTYDVVMLDAFGGDLVPPALATVEFLRAVRAVMMPGGAVVSNVWDAPYNRQHDDMVATYRAAFDSVYVLPVPRTVNTVVIGLPRVVRIDGASFEAAGRKLAADQHFRYDLAEGAGSGLRSASQYTSGRVLRDGAG